MMLVKVNLTNWRIKYKVRRLTWNKEISKLKFLRKRLKILSLVKNCSNKQVKTWQSNLKKRSKRRKTTSKTLKKKGTSFNLIYKMSLNHPIRPPSNLKIQTMSSFNNWEMSLKKSNLNEINSDSRFKIWRKNSFHW